MVFFFFLFYNYFHITGLVIVQHGFFFVLINLHLVFSFLYILL